MGRFDVWAPTPDQVRLSRRRRRSSRWLATTTGGGATDAGARRRGDYGYLLDDDEALPDPRSRWQPDGVNGALRTSTTRSPGPTTPGRAPARRVRWSTSCTSARSPREGTLDAALDRLDHLDDLGVDARRAHAGDAVPRHGTTGATTASTCSPSTRPTAGRRRYQRFVDGCHAARARCAPRRGLQPPRARRATTCRCSAPTSRTSGQHLGRRGQPRRRRITRRCGGSSSTTP